MDFDVMDASKKLSQYDLNFMSGNLVIDVRWVRVMPLEKEWLITRHMHSSYEFQIVASGASTVLLDDSEFVDIHLVFIVRFLEMSENLKIMSILYI